MHVKKVAAYAEVWSRAFQGALAHASAQRLLLDDSYKEARTIANDALDDFIEKLEEIDAQEEQKLLDDADS